MAIFDRIFGYTSAPSTKKDDFNPSQILKDNQGFSDCLTCRLLGSATLAGLGAYTYISGSQQLNARRQELLTARAVFGYGPRKFALATTSLALVGAGVYRWRM